jgi:hypothetical protein
LDNQGNFQERLVQGLGVIASVSGQDEPSGAADAPVPAPVQQEIDELLGPAQRPMIAMPETAKWVASGIQRLILAEELPFIAEQIKTDQKAGADTNPAAEAFTAVMDDAAATQQARLAKCRISDETFASEVNSRLFQQTLKRTVLVALAAAADSDKLPGPAKAALRGMRAQLWLVPPRLIADSLTLAQRLKDRPRHRAGGTAGGSDSRSGT